MILLDMEAVVRDHQKRIERHAEEAWMHRTVDGHQRTPTKPRRLRLPIRR